MIKRQSGIRTTELYAEVDSKFIGLVTQPDTVGDTHIVRLQSAEQTTQKIVAQMWTRLDGTCIVGDI